MKLLKNYFYSMIYQVINLLTPLLTLPYLAKNLGKENLGNFAFVNSILQYFLIFTTLGISIYGNREIAKVKENKEKRSIVFFELCKIKSIAGIFVLSVYFFYVVYFIKSLELKLIYCVMSGYIFSNIIDISWFYMGIEQFKKIAKRQFLIKISLLILIFLLIRNRSDLLLYIWIVVILEIASQIYMWINLDKEIEYKFFHNTKMLSHLTSLFSLFLPIMITTFYTNMDKIFIGNYINKEEVAIYDVSLKIITILITLVNSMTPVMISRISNSLRDEKATQKYIYNSFKYLSLVAFPMTFGLMAISKELIILFLGIEFEKSGIVLSLLSFMIVANVVGSIFVNYIMIPFGKEKIYQKVVYIMAIIYLLLDILLIPKYGAIGAAIACTSAHIIIIIIQSYFLRNCINIKEIILSMKNPFLVGLLMFMMMEVISFRDISPLLTLFIKITIGILFYISFFFYFYNKEIKHFLKNRGDEEI